MTVNLSMLAGAGAQFFDNNGNVLSGGKIYTYVAGTTTPQVTYTTSSGSTAHANPIVLDSAGRVPSGGEIWLTSGVAYKFVVKTSTDVTIGTYDNVYGADFDAIASVLNTLAASNGSSLIGYQPAGTGAVTTTIQAKLRQTVSAIDRGADPTGAADSSAAIIAALSDATHVIVPPGTYRCDSMIELTDGKTLQLMGGATLKRFSAYSASTDPVVWIKGSSASFFGAGQASSIVKTENRAPKGIVRLGHKDMTESHGNVNYCSLQNMSIVGAVANGQVTGDPDIALYMPNPQFSNLTSYFHNIFGLRVMDANIGIYLHGWANANTIGAIQGYRLGNVTLGTNKNVFIYCHGALDNAVDNCFFHASASSIGLLVDDCNNTANGGTTHSVYANSWRGMVFEQGGASAYGLKSLITGGRSYYELVSNVALGNSVPATFYDGNILVGAVNSSVNGGGASFSAVTSRGAVSATTDVSGATVTSSGDLAFSGAARGGDGGVLMVATKAKRSTTSNAATTTHTLSCTSPGGSIHRAGYLHIKCSGTQNDSTGLSAAWFMYKCRSISTAYPAVFTLVDSGGDTTAFTVSFSNGVVTVATVMDDLTTNMEFGFSTGGVNIS